MHYMEKCVCFHKTLTFSYFSIEEDQMLCVRVQYVYEPYFIKWGTVSFDSFALYVASWHFPNKKPELDHNWPTKPACLIEMNEDFSRLWVQIQFLAVLVVYLLPNVLTVRHKITAELLTFKHILLTGILSVRPHCKNTKFYLYSSD